MKRVVFFGGKTIGCKCLESLCLHSRIDVSLIVSNTSDLYDENDRWYPRIYELAKNHKIPYLCTDNPNTEEIISIIKGINSDFIFVVYYDAILKPQLFRLAKEEAINLHLADAERYRGCYPTTYAIINGEKEYGVTLHYVDEGVDTGPIIDKKLFEIKEIWTGKDLYDVATEEGYKLFVRNLDKIIEGKVESRMQKPSGHVKYHKRSQFPSYKISFEGTGKDVYNRIRALLFPPFPSPYFRIGDKIFEITEAKDKKRKKDCSNKAK